MKQKLEVILLEGILIFLTGISISQAAEQNSNAVSRNQVQDVSFAGLVDIGKGRKMYLECQGDGSPTVVLVSGRSDRADIWRTPKDPATPGPTVFPEVAKFTHVCAYDRPGTVTITSKEAIEPSRSAEVPQPTTAKDGVDDLHALLIAAKVPSPYVLVGHSWGGMIVRLYASTYPNEVAGLVLVDILSEQLYDALPQQLQAIWLSLNSNYTKDLDRFTTQERTDFIRSFEQLRAAPPLRQMPVVVLTSDRSYDFKSMIAKGLLPSNTPLELGSIIFQAHLTGQERLSRLLNARHITNTHAGHYIQKEQPQLVIDAIQDVVDQIRKAAVRKD